MDLGLLKSEYEPRVVDLDLKFSAKFFFFFVFLSVSDYGAMVPRFSRKLFGV